MENIRIRISDLLLTILLFVAGFAIGSCSTFSRSSFPEDFLFGTAAAAYQYEGAAEEGGKGPSIWDSFTHKHLERIVDKTSGDVAVDFYHRYKDDIKLMKQMGTNAFRFSISWPRILPNGSLSGGVNKQGVEFYNNLINELISNGLQPFITIFHWDLPQALEDEYGGFLSDRIVKDYVDFAEVCFKEFGDRVKHWITFNEPWTFCSVGYDLGKLAPARCTPQEGRQCLGGNSATEPYTVCHHTLVAHGEAVHLYKQKYQANQKGEIGITLASHWYTPYSPSKADEDATRRSLDFLLGWFMDPLTHGDYPSTMKELVGNRLPKFTKKQSDMINGSYDFVGLNYYTTHYAFDVPPSNNSASKSFTTDSQAGLNERSNSSIPLKVALKDDLRVSYHRKHLLYLQRAIRDGVDVRGYFAWSFMDSFEWSNGFTTRFGLYYVDYSDGLKRYPKKSAHWFRHFLTGSNDL
uniref:Beta-glucosidase 12-like n=1 Tax=Ananas comosus var. bracteatus TaxID=296719 RepID=A0A6V7Q3X8_ANACO|nr:unnamed protein product [Ananas comosus var. bracteatus]